MNSYNDFAFVYDSLMKQDVDYENWVDYIENLFHIYDKDISLVCDLACGTGNMTIPLAKRGYNMIGVDISSNMLSVASEKAYKDKLDILFLNQNIAKLDLYGTVDTVLCMIDGFNYILSPKTLLEIFIRIKESFLETDGLLIFDISSEYKLSKIIGDNTFIHNEKDLFYTWQNNYIASKKLSDMYLNFFKREGEVYERFEERHLQRAYSEKEIRCILKKAGFSKVDSYNELTFDEPTEKSERIVFVARV